MNLKFYTLILLSLFLTFHSFSQNNFKVGVNVGGQLKSLRGFEFPVDNTFEVGLMLGINAQIELSEHIAIVTGFNFDRTIKKIDLVFFDNPLQDAVTRTFNERYEFFNIPLLVRYKFGNKKQFFIDAGGFLEYFNKAEPTEFTSLFINFEDYNYGLAFGAGVLFPITENTDITLQLRNDLGLTDINKFPNQTPGEIKTNTLRLVATYNFGF